MSTTTHQPTHNVLRYLGIIVGLLVLPLLAPSTTLAQFLVITDCNGFTRAAERIGDKAQKVELNIRGARDGARVSLTNEASGAVVYADVVDNVALFFGILAGTYILGSDDSNLVLETIELSPTPLVGSMGSTIVGALTVGGGLTGGIIGITELTDGNPGNESAPPPPTPSPTPVPNCPVCDPDNTPPSLNGEDDFFDGNPPSGDNGVEADEPLSPAT
jgi:hypothetical protein